MENKRYTLIIGARIINNFNPLQFTIGVKCKILLRKQVSFRITIFSFQLKKKYLFKLSRVHNLLRKISLFHLCSLVALLWFSKV